MGGAVIVGEGGCVGGNGVVAGDEDVDVVVSESGACGVSVVDGLGLHPFKTRKSTLTRIVGTLTLFIVSFHSARGEGSERLA